MPSSPLLRCPYSGYQLMSNRTFRERLPSMRFLRVLQTPKD